MNKGAKELIGIVTLLLLVTSTVVVLFLFWPQISDFFFKRYNSFPYEKLGPFGDSFAPLNVIISGIGIILLGITLLYTSRQHIINEKQKSSEYLIQLTEKLYSDENLLKIRYKIEYQSLIYNLSGGFHGNQNGDEIHLDQLLNQYNLISKLYYSASLKLEDVEILAYDFIIVYQDGKLQEYLKTLDGWFKRRGIKVKPFGEFRKLAEEMKSKYYESTPKPV